jgi:hypothetical protein
MELRCYFKRDLYIQVNPGFITVGKGVEELACASLSDICSFIKRLKLGLAEPQFRVKFAGECYLCPTRIIFGPESVNLSGEQLFHFLEALSGLNFMLADSLENVYPSLQLKLFCLFLVSKPIQSEQAEECLKSLKSGIHDHPLMNQFVHQNWQHSDKKTTHDLLKFFIFHQRVVQSYVTLFRLLKK